MKRTDTTAKPCRLSPLGVALLYAGFASLWIAFSDRLLSQLPLAPARLQILATLKGSLFVGITSLLLFQLLRIWREPVPQTGAMTPAIQPRSGCKLLLILLGLTLSLPLLGYGIVQLHKPQLEQDSLDNLGAISSLKAEQLGSWLRSRQGSGGVIMRNQAIVEKFAHFIDSRAPALPAPLREYLGAIQENYQYDNILLSNHQGRLLTAMATGTDISPQASALIAPALQRGQVLRTELYADARGRLSLDFVVPLRRATVAGPQPVGALILRTDPDRALFPLILAWPTRSPSGEILLVRREGRKGIYLNKLRHDDGNTSQLGFRLDDAERPGAMALQPGDSLQGLDYRGMSVLAAYRPVAGSDWMLQAKLDRDEVLAPLHNLMLWISLVTGFAILVVSAMVLMLWRQQGRAHQLALLVQAAEKDRLLRHFYSLPFIGMALVDPADRRWLQCNDKLCALLGYTAEELAQLSWPALIPAEDWELDQQQHQQLLSGQIAGYQQEKRLLHRDGHPIEVSLEVRALHHEDGSLECLVAMIEDITARRQGERALRRQRDLYNCLSETNQTIVRTPDRDELFTNICRIAVEHGGFRFAWIGLRDEASETLRPASQYGDDGGYVQQARISLSADSPRGRGISGQAIRAGRYRFSNDVQADPAMAPWHAAARLAGIRSVGAFPIRQAGEVIGVLNLYSREPGFFTPEVLATLDEMATDVSFALDNLVREQERTGLLAELQMASQVIDASPVVLYRSRPEPGLPLDYISDNVRIWGYSAKQLLDDASVNEQVVYQDDLPKMLETVARYSHDGLGEYHHEYRIVTAAGELRWVEDHTTINRDEQGRVRYYEGVITDITERKQAEEALRESEALFHTLANLAPVGIFRADASGHCRYINARGAAIAGLTTPDLCDACWLNNIHEDDRAGVAEFWMQAITTGSTFRRQFRFHHADGSDTWVMGVAEPEHDDQGIISGYIGTITDISDMKDKEIRLRQAAAVFENTREGIMVTDQDNRILLVNPALCELLGYSQAQMLGRTPSLFKSGRHDRDFYLELRSTLDTTGHWRGEIWNRCKNGEVRPQLLSINAIKDEAGQLLHYVSVYTDIAQIKESEAKLEYLAKHDPLTGLPNRFLLTARLQHALEHAKRKKERLALLVLDLDRFKDINDSFGHGVGDALLREAARRLTARLRHSDTVCRLGGDEFTLLLEGNPSTAAVASVAQQVIETLQRPWQLPNGREVSIGASIGISLYPEYGHSPDELLQQADAALYRAKSEGRACFRFFSDELTRAAQERLTIESRLRQALAHNEFRLHYQPLIEIASGRIMGAEALLRWHSPDEGEILPGRFIPIAEETGLINPIGDWVLGEACRQAQSWHQAGLPALNLAINLSPRQFRHGDIGSTVAGILARTGYPAERLTLEITEGALMARELESSVILARLREQGVRIAIDDFGTGYSSLAYLKQLPLDELKIDKRFVDDIPHDPSGMEIATTVIAMAHNLGLKVLAEGVETAAQLDFLRDKGCDGFQGYLVSKPLPAPEFTRMLQRNAARCN